MWGSVQVPIVIQESVGRNIGHRFFASKAMEEDESSDTFNSSFEASRPRKLTFRLGILLPLLQYEWLAHGCSWLLGGQSCVR